MKEVIYLLVFGFILTSCSKEAKDYTPDIYEFKTYEGTIEVDSMNLADSSMSYSYSVINGYSRVFEVNYSRAQYNDIYDDEYGERLVFMIPTSLDTFFLEDENLINAVCLFNRWGAWTSSYVYKIKKGEITGQRIDDHRWSVYINIETDPILNEAVDEITFEGIFVEE